MPAEPKQISLICGLFTGQNRKNILIFSFGRLGILLQHIICLPGLHRQIKQWIYDHQNYKTAYHTCLENDHHQGGQLYEKRQAVDHIGIALVKIIDAVIPDTIDQIACIIVFDVLIREIHLLFQQYMIHM